MAWLTARSTASVWLEACGLLLLEAALAGLLLIRRRAALAALAELAPGGRGRRDETGIGQFTLAPWADAEARAVARRLQGEVDATTAQLVAAQLQLLSFHDAIRGITSANGRAQIVDALLQHCLRRFGVGEAHCFLPARGQKVVRRTLCSHEGEMGLTETSLDRPGVGGLAMVLGEGRSLLIGDPAQHPLVPGEDAPAAAASGYLAVPLPAVARSPAAGAAGAGGALVLCGRVGPGGLDESARASLEALGRAAGALLENAGLYAKLNAEHALREGILNSLAAGLVAFGPDGRSLFHNRAAQGMLGLSPARFAALTPATLSQDLGRPGSPFVQVAAGERPLVSGESTVARAEGGPLTVRLTVARLPAPEATAEGLLCLFEDLTSLRAMQDQIRQLDKLAAIGRFTSSLAHEIRNPLAGIAAGIDYLRRDGGLGDEHQEYIRIISQEIDRLDRIIRNLFAVARPGYLMIRRRSLEPILNRVLAFLGPMATQKQVSFASVQRRPWVDAECDEDQLQQVMLNLLKNAVEAEAEGGTVRIIVDQGAWDPYAKRIASAPADGVVLTVENRGETIAPAEMERIFEPFYTRKSQGTGLGLFVSYNIMKQHNGALEVASDPGGVTRFRLYLPWKQPGQTEGA